MNLKPLIDILKHEQRIHTSMLVLKKEERKYLALGDSENILNAVQELTSLADKAANLEEQRRDITAAIALELNLNIPEPTLREILEILPPYNRAELESTGKELLDTVYQLKEQNRANTRILQQSMETLNQEITNVCGQQDSGVYTAQGSRQKQNQPLRAGLNIRA